MRIRQVRPEFFSDGRVAKLRVEVRLTYIGLWCIADDAGWLAWDVVDLAAQLYPYESIRVRERRLGTSGEALVEAGRLVMYPCGCAHIPTLADHQRIGGNKSFTAKDRYDKHKSIHSRTSPPVVSEVGSELDARARATEDDDERRAAERAAWRRQGLPVDVAS